MGLRVVVGGWSRAGRWRGGTSGRSSLIDGDVRLIFEGFTSRPGVRRGSLSRSGRGRPGSVAHSRTASLRATVLGLPGARARPDSVPGAIVGVWSVKGCGLPEERGEFACARDRDDTGGLAPLDVQVLPALVQASLGAPCDLDDAWVLAMLAACEGRADVWLVAVVVRGFDQQPACVAGAGFGDRALAALGVRGSLGWDDPQEPGEQGGSREPSPVADLCREPGTGERVDPAEAAQPGDHGGVAGVGDRVLERSDQCASATSEQLDRGEVVNERALRAGIFEIVGAQPGQMLGRPRAAAPGAERTRSRKLSSWTLGTNAKLSSRCARSVLTRSPGPLGIEPGAATRTSISRSRPALANPNPVVRRDRNLVHHRRHETKPATMVVETAAVGYRRDERAAITDREGQTIPVGGYPQTDHPIGVRLSVPDRIRHRLINGEHDGEQRVPLESEGPRRVAGIASRRTQLGDRGGKAQLTRAKAVSARRCREHRLRLLGRAQRRLHRASCISRARLRGQRSQTRS